MELTIFDNIIFGPLQPWQAANQNEQRFSDLIRQAGRSLPGTGSELNKKLSILLQDYPDTHKHINKNSNTNLPLYLYSVHLPRHFNSTTEYYSLLMQNSALHFMQLLTTAIDVTQHDDEAYYLVNTSLDKIKYMAAGAATELESRNLKGVPDYKTENSVATSEAVSRNTHFIFYTAMQHNIRLFFDLQKRYEQYVKATETEEQFYIQTIKENYPEQSPIEPTVFYFEWKVQKLLDNPEYSSDAALQLLEEIKQSEETNKATNANTSIENFIFAHMFDVDLEELQVANLANFATSAKYFEQVKQNLNKEVNQLNYGYQRLEVIAAAMERLNVVAAVNSQSAIASLSRWLKQQETLYTNLFKDKLPVETEETETTSNPTTTKISFGYTGQKEKLKNVIVELGNKVELLNEEHSNANELLAILTSKNIIAASTKIYLGCETVQFRYIVDKLSRYFNNLTPKEIEKTECFYSKKNTLIKAQNLYSNKVDTPKDQSIIDNIINQLQ